MDQLSAPTVRVEPRPEPVVAGKPSRRGRRRALRVRRHAVETVVRVFEEPETGRLVHLIATMHIGTPAYYGTLSALLADLDSGGTAAPGRAPGAPGRRPQRRRP